MKILHNLFISIGEIYTESPLILKIVYMLVLSLPFIGLGYWLKQSLASVDLDVEMDLSIILIYTLIPMLFWFLTCLGLHLLSFKQRKK